MVVLRSVAWAIPVPACENSGKHPAHWGCRAALGRWRYCQWRLKGKGGLGRSLATAHYASATIHNRPEFLYDIVLCTLQSTRNPCDLQVGYSILVTVTEAGTRKRALTEDALSALAPSPSPSRPPSPDHTSASYVRGYGGGGALRRPGERAAAAA